MKLREAESLVYLDAKERTDAGVHENAWVQSCEYKAIYRYRCR